MSKNQFIEIKPNLYHPDCTAVWMPADDIEQSTYNTLNQYEIDWDCKPKPKWFDLSDDDSHLILNLPILHLTPRPDGGHTMRIVSGPSRMMWMLGTNLNEVMVMIFRDQHPDWTASGFDVHPANLRDRIRVNDFDVNGMMKLKSGSSGGGWFSGMRERMRAYGQGVIPL